MVFKYGLNGLKWFLNGENSDQKSCFFFPMFHGRFRRKRACSLVLCRPVGLPSKVVEIWVTTSCFKPHCVIWMWFTYISIKSSDVGCIPNPFEVVKPSHQISFRTWHGRPGGCTTSMRSPCLQCICISIDIHMLVNTCIMWCFIKSPGGFTCSVNHPLGFVWILLPPKTTGSSTFSPFNT